MWIYIFASLVGLLGIVYFRMRQKFSYFRSKGIAEEPAYFPLGGKATWKMLTGKLAFTNITNHIYTEYPNEKIVGTYGPFGTPYLVVRDLELAKNVMIKDFDHFVDRRPIEMNPKSNKYFMDMLTVMNGERWKTMRNILSPVFTSGKLRNMMPIIHNVGDDFVTYLKDLSDRDEAFDAKELMTSYTLDVISNAGLGVQANSFTDPNSLIRQKVGVLMGTSKDDPFSFFRIMMIFIFPKIARILNIPFINIEASEFIVGVIRSSVELRKKEKIRKNDLIDILIDALNDYEKNSDSMSTEEEDQFEKDAKLETKSVEKVFSHEEIEAALISNALLLFFAGFDTSSTGMSLASYFLATNPDVQEQLFREVSDAIAQNGGNAHLDYNAVQSLPYLDQIVNESLRVYPLTFIERLCVKDYKVPGFDFVVPKGMMVQIASPMIMKDEKYFSNPEKFDPENFSSEKKAERSPYSFLAFGQGPRNCVGMRFALLQVKTAIARLVTSYKLLPCSKTVDKLVTDPMSRSFMPKGGIWIKVQKR